MHLANLTHKMPLMTLDYDSLFENHSKELGVMISDSYHPYTTQQTTTTIHV